VDNLLAVLYDMKPGIYLYTASWS